MRHLIGQQHHVATVDALTYAGHRESLGSVLDHPNHRFEHIDIREREAMGRVFSDARPDIVIHLAAESHVDRSIDDPMDFVTTNVLGTVVLLQAALDHWRALPSPQRKHFRVLHVSTDEVYGSLGKTGVFTEHSPYRPSSPYAASKASSDHFARAWHQTFGLPVLISHCSNNYGPYQMPEKLVPVVILAALEGRPIPIYGNGRNLRDWLFVDDHVLALEAIAHEGRPGSVYNVGSNQETANIDLARSLCSWMDELLPASPHRPHEDLLGFVADRPGHDQRYAIDTTRVRDELGWTPRWSLHEGLGRTVRWYLDNRWWWQAIRRRGFDDRVRQGLGGADRAGDDVDRTR